ncbi:MAG: hydrogenase, Fe-only, partial [Pelosinus sp.]|nr:hydrogenase, Fe-only [Pelosinus sp.]
MQHVANPNNEVTLTIDGISVRVPEGTLIIDAAKKIGIQIPILCYHPDLAVRATCRVCLVEIKGQRKLKTACSNEVWEGVEIITNSKVVREA